MRRRILSGRSDANTRFDDLRMFLLRLGFAERMRGNHHIFRKDGVRDRINLQRDGSHAKPYQVPTGPPGSAGTPAIGECLMHKYEIIIYLSDEDGVFVATAPELPGCAAHVESQQAELDSINQAMDLWLETAREFGDPISKPKGERLTPA